MITRRIAIVIAVLNALMWAAASPWLATHEHPIGACMGVVTAIFYGTAAYLEWRRL